MREIQAQIITQTIAETLQEISYQLSSEVKTQLEKAYAQETSPLGRQALELLLRNAEIAAAGVFPLCQDTGLTVIWIEIGQEVMVTGGELEAALQNGVRQATQTARLRNSLLAHPLRRQNTGDNTPAVIHYRVVPGKGLKVKLMAKGGGCENASALSMLPPSAGEAGVVDFVVSTVRQKGAAACPPLLLGIGIGGNFETAPLLAKQALFRKLGEPSADPEIARLENDLLKKVNDLGLGPQGWGGKITAFAVAVEIAPCHIASLPVAVNFECHSHRVKEINL